MTDITQDIDVIMAKNGKIYVEGLFILPSPILKIILERFGYRPTSLTQLSEPLQIFNMEYWRVIDVIAKKANYILYDIADDIKEIRTKYGKHNRFKLQPSPRHQLRESFSEAKQDRDTEGSGQLEEQEKMARVEATYEFVDIPKLEINNEDKLSNNNNVAINTPCNFLKENGNVIGNGTKNLKLKCEHESTPILGNSKGVAKSKQADYPTPGENNDLESLKILIDEELEINKTGARAKQAEYPTPGENNDLEALKTLIDEESGVRHKTGAREKQPEGPSPSENNNLRTLKTLIDVESEVRHKTKDKEKPQILWPIPGEENNPETLSNLIDEYFKNRRKKN